MINSIEGMTIILCIVVFLGAVWQKTVLFSGLSAFVNAAALFIGFMFVHANVLFFPVPAILTLVSLFLALYETINGDLL